MRMNLFSSVPVRIRLIIVLSFLVASVTVGIAGRPSRTLLLAAIVLFLAGAWRISAARSLVLFLILVPALIALLLTHFDWHHPFFARYLAGLFSVVAVLLLLDGIRVEEWIEIIGGTKGRAMAPLLIGTAVGTISLASNIREQRACRKLANISSWRAKSSSSIFLDSLALPFYNAVESHEFIDEALHRWGARSDGASVTQVPPGLTFGNSNLTATLADVEDFPCFEEFRMAVLSGFPVAKPWVTMIGRLTRPARILEVGDYAGQVTNHLLSNNFTVIAVADVTRLALSGPSPGLTVVEPAWDTAPVCKYDHIFLHHDSFLKMANQLPLRDALVRLYELSKPSAHICFDYPVTVMPMAQGTIFSGTLKEVGEVKYHYSQHERKAEVHKFRLEYTLRREHELSCVRAPMTFTAPELTELLAVAREVGFLSSAAPMPGIFSFVAGETALVELRRWPVRS